MRILTNIELTCHAFKQALRQNTGLRRVYLHFRQTQVALPKSYGAIREKTCIRIYTMAFSYSSQSAQMLVLLVIGICFVV